MTTKKKTTKKKSAASTAKQPYVIVRATRAGVHAGYLVSDKGAFLRLRSARRIWFWSGAASLSEIAVYGCNPVKSGECRFGARVEDQRIASGDVCEVIVCQPEGQAMIEGQKEWRA